MDHHYLIYRHQRAPNISVHQRPSVVLNPPSFASSFLCGQNKFRVFRVFRGLNPSTPQNHFDKSPCTSASCSSELRGSILNRVSNSPLQNQESRYPF
ncbi:MAG: hypothetical protein JXR40_10150, partial [Pontiellaceae bacterium]|nr:hypothetical protein [Pontiellaceae bacterium]